MRIDCTLQGKELRDNQHQTEDFSCLPTLQVSDIPLKQESYEVAVGPHIMKGEKLNDLRVAATGGSNNRVKKLHSVKIIRVFFKNVFLKYVNSPSKQFFTPLTPTKC